jgi:uncharacterized protein (DUF885 family)
MNRTLLAAAAAAFFTSGHVFLVAQVAGPPVGPSPAIRPAPAGRSPQLWTLMNDLLEASLERNGDAGLQFGDERYLDRLYDASPASVAEWNRIIDGFRSRLAALDRAGWREDDRTDADLLEYSFSLDAEGRPFHAEQMPVSAIDGPQFGLPQMSLTLPFRTAWHFEAYTRRLEQIPRLLDQQVEQMRLGIKAGRTQPRSVVAKSLPVARAIVVDNPDASPFFKPFLGRPEDERSARARRAIQEGVIPAYARFADFLEREYIPVCRESTAASDGVDGRPAYDHQLRSQTTTGLTAEEIHRLGLSEVARLRGEMFQAITRTDFPAKDSLHGDELFTAFVTFVRTEPRFYHTTPEALLTQYRDICKRIDAELPKLFGTLPRTPYGVREIPRFAAPTSPTAYYYPGAMKSGVAGMFMANTYQLDQRPRYEAVALTMHEAVPGHHLQIALSQELENTHPLRATGGYTAFVEGWALYAEGLGLEMSPEGAAGAAADLSRGLYADPYDDFGRLNMEMWRAMRLVVDTGLHSMGWTRRQAIDYMVANSALARLNIENEVDRYIGWPGQACAYKIGQLKILELRHRAQAALGDRFDIRAFHDVVLSGGALPLPVLEKRVTRWVEEQSSRGDSPGAGRTTLPPGR